MHDECTSVVPPSVKHGFLRNARRTATSSAHQEFPGVPLGNCQRCSKSRVGEQNMQSTENEQINLMTFQENLVAPVFLRPSAAITASIYINKASDISSQLKRSRLFASRKMQARGPSLASFDRARKTVKRVYFFVFFVLSSVIFHLIFHSTNKNFP